MNSTALASEIEAQLEAFESIALAEMAEVKLMDRVDIKFMIPSNRLPKILHLSKSHYRILSIEGRRLFRYETLYFDTTSLRLYHHHQTGRANRYKIRYRNYVDSGLSFFEVKFKSNKGRTIKTRVDKQGSAPYALDARSIALLTDKTQINPADLSPVLWVNYRRITLVSIDSKERITLDLDLTFKNGEKQKQFLFLAIAEVKQEKEGKESVFLEIMRQQRLTRGGISKYCFGVISLFEAVKRNRFKSKVKFIQKIQFQNQLYDAVRFSEFARAI
jgi:hypothetical protein